MKQDILVTSAIVIPESDLSWAAVRSSGPGGQNVNKVSSKVELRFDLEGSRVLRPEVKERLRALAKSKLDAEGRIVIVSQLTRDQSRNAEDAADKLAELVRAALVVPKKRRPTKRTRGSNERRIQGKKIDGAKKVQRRTRGDD